MLYKIFRGEEELVSEVKSYAHGGGLVAFGWLCYTLRVEINNKKHYKQNMKSLIEIQSEVMGVDSSAIGKRSEEGTVFLCQYCKHEWSSNSYDEDDMNQINFFFGHQCPSCKTKAVIDYKY